MGVRPTALVSLLVALPFVAGLMLAPAARAESLDSCAQRVIRDWYSGGRVDGIYPLPCYRAAIRALPDDVLQYSDADRDIARALAYARRGMREKAAGVTPVADARASTSPGPSTQPKDRPASKNRVGGSVHLASGAESVAAGGGVPYPIIALGLLSVVLFVSAGAGWLAHRRR